MKFSAASTIAILSVATAGSSSGPRFTINVSDPSLPDGVGSLGLEGEYSRELAENFNAGLKYDYAESRGLPSSIWASTSADIDDDTKVRAKAEYNLKSKSTVIDAKIERKDDSIAIDYDTATNQAGPLRLCKTLDMNGRRVTLKPKVDIQDRTGELVVNADIEEDKTTAEISFNQKDDSATLEVSHRLDDYNIVSPKVNLRSGDISVRLNRALENGGIVEVTADKKNVDWSLSENQWTVKGNIPLKDTGSSTISFKRTISLT